MSTVCHITWTMEVEKSATKRNLEYWIELAKLLDRGGFNTLFLADPYGGYDAYEGSLDDCIRRASQWPMTNPTITKRSARQTRSKRTRSAVYQTCSPPRVKIYRNGRPARLLRKRLLAA
ncbi:hypothetical protein F5Y06DRAFT_271453 [Hypoxylon sp. FL0890]|nr:hypothetical protein F5Y06DRAFT_271453 [Hypoxylon sp. FL0890]